MIHGDAGVDHRDAYVRAPAHCVRLGDRHLRNVMLQIRVGIVVMIGLRPEGLQWLNGFDSPVSGEPCEKLVAFRVLRHGIHETVHVEQRNRPAGHLP